MHVYARIDDDRCSEVESGDGQDENKRGLQQCRVDENVEVNCLDCLCLSADSIESCPLPSCQRK